MSVLKHLWMKHAKISKKSCNVGIKTDKTCWTSADMFWASVGERGFANYTTGQSTAIPATIFSFKLECYYFDRCIRF